MSARRLPLAALTALLLLAPPALAQEEGVTIDPDSPSAKEYEIPIESARRGAEPGRDPGAPVQSGERGAPLFGAGVSEGEPSPRDAKPRSDGKRRERPAATATPRPETPEAVRAAASSPGAPPGGTGTNALVIGGGLAVLGLGAGAGLLARRRG